MILILFVLAVAVPMRGAFPVYVAGNAALTAALIPEAAVNLAPVGLAGHLLVMFVVFLVAAAFVEVLLAFEIMVFPEVAVKVLLAPAVKIFLAIEVKVLLAAAIVLFFLLAAVVAVEAVVIVAVEIAHYFSLLMRNLTEKPVYFIVLFCHNFCYRKIFPKPVENRRLQ